MTKPARRTCLKTGIKYGTNDSTAEISVKYLFVTTLRVWLLFFHWPGAHA